MIRKLVSSILPLIVVAGALSTILGWLNITPVHISNNKFISGVVNFLNFKIPVYLVSLIVLIAIFLYKYKIANMGQKKPLPVEKKAEEIKEDKIINLLSDSLTINQSLRLSRSSKKAVEFLHQEKVKVKTIQRNFCHAKTFIYKDKDPRKNFHIVGSSNLTDAGLGIKESGNIELNRAGNAVFECKTV